MSNSVLFVSLGPGDPELITLKALKALQEADEVFCPAAGSGSRSAAILSALGIVPEKIRTFTVPMSEDRSAAVEAYADAAETVVESHRAGRKVAVAAEGDAGFYSSSDYIAEILTEADIPMTHIAGVPAFLACGALAGIPVVRLNETLEVVPGTITVGSLAAKLAEGKTVVIMKTSRCEVVIKEAMQNLPEAEFHYFENAGVAGREFYSADNDVIIARNFPYFSLMIIRATPEQS
jgi:precorrin-2/cobalt-factor-2 C20-methyltransferase